MPDTLHRMKLARAAARLNTQSGHAELPPLIFLTDDERTPDPEALALRAADADQVRAALERLPPEHREILALREFEECSYKEIASVTGLKIGTVMSRLARARERLQQELMGAEASP